MKPLLAAALLFTLAAVFSAQQPNQLFPERFPVDYQGDLAALVERIGANAEKIKPERPETTEQWYRRVRPVLESRVNGHAVRDSAIVVTPSCLYDEETKSWTCTAFDSLLEGVKVADRSHAIAISGEKKVEGTWGMSSQASVEAEPWIRLVIVGQPYHASGHLMIAATKAAFFNQKTGEKYLAFVIRESR
jgi:hypothetical protein